MRIGPNLHEIEMGRPASWDPFIEKIEKMWENEISPTVTMAFFPSLKRWEKLNVDGSIDQEHSYLLHPDFAHDMGQMTEEFMTRVMARKALFERNNPTKRKPRIAINGVNEPETFAGFNRQFWHGDYANWFSPLMNKFYIPSIINIAKANVQIRLAIERSTHEAILFMYNEAMTTDEYISHRGGGRFAVSKFMLGDDVLMKSNFDESFQSFSERIKDKPTHNEMDWALKAFTFGSWNEGSSEKQQMAYEQLIGEFKQLRDLHKSLPDGKTMKTNTYLALDYNQTEAIPKKEIPVFLKEVSANHGQKLKEILGALDDEKFLDMMKAASENREDLEGKVKIPFNYKNREDVPFEKVLSDMDSELLSRLVGFKRQFELSSDPEHKARQTEAGLLASAAPLESTDSLVAKMSADDGQELQRIMGLKSKEELLYALQRIGRDNSDGQGTSEFGLHESVEEILSKNGRLILNRTFGLKRHFKVGFEPQHYARQMRAGMRDGFYKFLMDYTNALGIRVVGVGESGTPYHNLAPLLHDQHMMSLASAGQSGLYLAMYNIGSTTNTVGWEYSPMALPAAMDQVVNPSGIFNIPVEGQPVTLMQNKDGSLWFRQFAQPFEADIKKYFDSAKP